MNTLLAHWHVPPEINVHCEPSFPLEERIKALAREKEMGQKEIFKDGQVNWDLLRDIWSEALYINPGIDGLEWREQVLSIIGLEESVASSSKRLHLEGRKTDSYTIQAQRRGYFPNSSDVLQTAIVGIVESGDGNELILGRRAGSEGVGEIIPVPAGAVPYPLGHKNDHNSLTPALLRETVDETGIVPEEIADLKLIGIYRQELGSATPSNVFLYILKLHDTLDTIRERHQLAFEYYESSKREGLGNSSGQEIYARRVLQRRAKKVRGFPADAWEHSRLFSFTVNPETISKAVSALLEVEKVKPLFYGAMALYILHRFGKKHYQKILNLPYFKEQVQEGYMQKI